MSVFTDPLGKIMEELLDMYNRLPKNLHMKLYTQLRLGNLNFYLTLFSSFSFSPFIRKQR